MSQTLKRIVRAGLPAGLVLAAVGYGLAELAGAFLSAQVPAREVVAVDGADPAAAPPDPLPADLRRTLPLTMACWGVGLVTAYELLRRLVKGPAQPPKRSPVPAAGDVDKLLDDLLKKAEADRSTHPDPAAGEATPAAGRG